MLHIMGQASLLHMECCTDLAIFITLLSIIIFVGYLTILQYYSLKEGEILGGTLGKCHPPLLALLIAKNFLDRRSVLPPLGTASANLYDTSTRQMDMIQDENGFATPTQSPRISVSPL